MNENKKNAKKYAELHLHSKDLFDSDNNPEKVCEKLAEYGAVGFASTQHGCLSNIEEMRMAAEKYGLKFVPGEEIYKGKSHLILLSKTYEGYRAIWMATSDKRAQNAAGYAVIDDELLQEYFGEGSIGHDNVIATSACIQGVIATVLRSNDIANNEIAKIERKAAKYIGSSVRVDSLAKTVADIDKEIEEANAKKNILTSYANAKFAKREKSIEKLKAAGDPSYENELEDLNLAKQQAEDAKAELEVIKTNIASLKKKRSANAKSLKELLEASEKEAAYSKSIDELKATLKSDEELFEQACAETQKYVKIFGEGNFYMEVQYHGIEKEKEIYPVIAKIARKLNVPLVATNDVHTIDNSKEELLKRQILRALRFGKWEEQQPGDDQLYIKTDDEMVEWLSMILPQDVVDEAMANIKVIFDQCNVVFPDEKHYPVFPSESGKSADKILYEEICKGVEWRFGGFDKLPAGYKERLRYEYNIITKMGYSDYHLIVKDFLEYGRALGPVPTEEIENAPFEIEALKKWTAENGWEGGFTIGPGRGSAVGSLVCYCLGITSLDPIKYDLLFERFLNPERVSMPDIDSDIAKRIRYKVIEYVRHKYGEESVCGIMTTNAQAPRGAIRIAAKYYSQSIGRDGEFLALGDKMAKMVPNEPGISFGSSFDSSKTVYEMLCNEYADNKDALTILEWAKTVEGCFTAYGAHAAGVVISDGKPVQNYVPLRWNEKLGEMTTQVDMVKVEEKGLIKMDFLGLKTLDIITDCIRMIQKRKGITIDPLKDIPMDDPRVFNEIFQKGRTNSVFQFESSGMKNMLKRFKPNSFEDLIILVSMFRPGPLQFLDDVIATKNGEKPLEFLTPELKPILGKTYGAITYQEQVMEIFQKLAGYTLGGADQVRRYMSKKKMDKLVHEREAFIHGDAERNIDGCVARGIDEEAADKLFDQMTDFAKYAFNKSHAAAYAANSYYTAWLKLYYPAEFLAAALNWAETEKYAGLINEAKSFGVNVLVPDVNYSEINFNVTPNGDIRFGLAGIKTVGAGAESIIKERNANGPYVSLIDFFKRSDAKKDAVQNLMRAGAFDAFHNNRAEMIETVELYKTAITKCSNKETQLSNMEAILPYIDTLDTKEKLEAKETELSIPFTTVPSVCDSKKLETRIENAKNALAELEDNLNNIVIPTVSENFISRINAERELLGVYVTGHPLDEYDKENNVYTIADAIDNEYGGRINILGVITAVRRKMNKKGEPIAFLDVEDKTSSINVCVYGPSYPSCGTYLEEGNVLVFTGRLSEDQRAEDDEKKFDFIVSAVRPASKHQKAVLITCLSQQSCGRTIQILKNKYADPMGRNCSIYIVPEDTLVDVEFKVSEEVLKHACASEY